MRQFSEEHKLKLRLARSKRDDKPMLGKHHSEQTKHKMRIARLGIEYSAETLEKMRLAKLGIKLTSEHKANIRNSVPRWEQSNHWKGDNILYGSLHQWVRKYLSQPKLCEFCNINDSKHLANITGVYNREFINWKYLCVKCHSHYDWSRR